MKTIAEKINFLIFKRKIKLLDLAIYLKISDVGLRKMIKNDSFKADVLYKIANYFKLPIGYFFDEVNNNGIDIGHKINGDNNKIESDITSSECQAQLANALKEIEYLKEINKLLKQKQAKNK